MLLGVLIPSPLAKLVDSLLRLNPVLLALKAPIKFWPVLDAAIYASIMDAVDWFIPLPAPCLVDAAAVPYLSPPSFIMFLRVVIAVISGDLRPSMGVLGMTSNWEEFCPLALKSTFPEDKPLYPAPTAWLKLCTLLWLPPFIVAGVKWLILDDLLSLDGESIPSTYYLSWGNKPF